MDDELLKYKAFFYLMAYSGFRRGEMLGLEWKDIDFENNIISVHLTSNQTKERGLHRYDQYETLKTHAEKLAV